jgi:5-methyltetrahydrofolate--homocysteine methyltransferase
MRPVLERIKDSFAEVRSVEDVKNLTEEALAQEISPTEIMESMSDGLRSAGQKYEQGDFFLSELIMSGIMAQEVANILRPRMPRSVASSLGRVVIGTVKGDIHDLGKNLVAMLLSSGGFEVVDLGVDVSADKFVDAVKASEPNVAAMSCLLTTAMDEMKNTVNKLKETGARENVKILVGGRPITPEFAREINADGYAEDAIQALNVAKTAVNNLEDKE